MKGLVFVEFMEFIEKRFSLEMVETLIEKSKLPNAGVYTSVGTYDPKDMLIFLGILHNETQIPVSELVKAFGSHLFSQLHKKYPGFFIKPKNTFEFLASVHNHVHVEVKKLYIDAELPEFQHHMEGPNKMIMDYKSARPLADLAEGMIAECIKHFKENIFVQRIDELNSGGKQLVLY